MLVAVGWTDVGLVLCACGIAALLFTLRALNRRLNTIEYRVTALVSQAGIDLEELPRREVSPQVRTLADVGERQLAVELHQRESGLSLDDAQVAVEAYMRGELPTGPSLTIRRSA